MFSVQRHHPTPQRAAGTEMKETHDANNQHNANN
jgi:hypothetical protein